MAWGDGGTVLGEAIRIGRGAGFGEVVVATDDDSIAAAAGAAGAAVARTSSEPRNGTERLAEALAAGALGTPEVVVNLQGDAVGASSVVVRAAVAALERADLATVAVRSRVSRARGRTTVTADSGFAVDFSRDELSPGDGGGARLLHVGVYAYRVDALRRVAALPMAERERTESLEQLRWLDAGLPIALAIVDGDARLAHAVDERSDLDR